MSLQYFKKSTAIIFCAVLAACGGGGGDDDTPERTGTGNSTGATGNGTTTPGTGGTTTPPSSGTGNGTPPSAGSGGNTPPSGPTAPSFAAKLESAPTPFPDGSFLGERRDGTTTTYDDTVRFEVSGTGLRNVELVSANDISIKYGTFTISEDGKRATLDWDYQLGDENGAYTTYDLRILAWNVPAGEAGEPIEVMGPSRYHRRASPGMCAVSGCVTAP